MVLTVSDVSPPANARARYAAPSATASSSNTGECSSRSPGVRGAGGAAASSSAPSSMWSDCASRAASPDGAASHMISVTTTSSIATDSRLCHKNTVCSKPTRPSGTTPPCAMMARTRAGSASGVAICSAADPESPCAHTLPSPSSDAAPNAR